MVVGWFSTSLDISLTSSLSPTSSLYQPPLFLIPCHTLTCRRRLANPPPTLPLLPFPPRRYRWIEAVISEEIGAIADMDNLLRDGVVLAKLAKFFEPTCVKKIFTDPKLQFRHSDNTNFFFGACKKSGFPDLFLFELTDVYDKKNIPKVIYCIHALRYGRDGASEGEARRGMVVMVSSVSALYVVLVCPGCPCPDCPCLCCPGRWSRFFL